MVVAMTRECSSGRLLRRGRERSKGLSMRDRRRGRLRCGLGSGEGCYKLFLLWVSITSKSDDIASKNRIGQVRHVYGGCEKLALTQINIILSEAAK